MVRNQIAHRFPLKASLTYTLDPPVTALGYPEDTNSGYNAFTDPSCSTPDEMFLKFSTWISSYFDHPDPLSGDLDKAWKGDGRDSFRKMTPDDLQLHYEPAAAAPTDFLL